MLNEQEMAKNSAADDLKIKDVDMFSRVQPTTTKALIVKDVPARPYGRNQNAAEGRELDSPG